MEPKYKSTISLEKLIPEAGIETTEAHRQTLSNATVCMSGYLTETGTCVDKRTLVDPSTPNDIGFREVYLSAEGIVVNLDYIIKPPYDRRNNGAITLISNTVPVDPLKNELERIIRDVYQKTKPVPDQPELSP